MNGVPNFLSHLATLCSRIRDSCLFWSDAFMNQSHTLFGLIFLPHSNPFYPWLGNYFSKHVFKLSLIKNPWWYESFIKHPSFKPLNILYHISNPNQIFIAPWQKLISKNGCLHRPTWRFKVELASGIFKTICALPCTSNYYYFYNLPCTSN